MALFGRRGAAAERRGTPADMLVVGLGNPGSDFHGSRHNAGAEVVDLLASRHGGALKRSRERSLVAEVRIDDQRVVLAFPQTYMNLSGEAVALLVRRHGITEPTQVVVVHDELDIMVREAADAVELILADGIDAAMNRVNTTPDPG